MKTVPPGHTLKLDVSRTTHPQARRLAKAEAAKVEAVAKAAKPQRASGAKAAKAAKANDTTATEVSKAWDGSIGLGAVQRCGLSTCDCVLHPIVWLPVDR